MVPNGYRTKGGIVKQEFADATRPPRRYTPEVPCGCYLAPRVESSMVIPQHMRTRTILGVTFFCTGLILLVIAYARAGAAPEEVYRRLGQRDMQAGREDWALQARLLQSAYVAGAGFCLMAVGGVGIITGARSPAPPLRDNQPLERTGPAV